MSAQRRFSTPARSETVPPGTKSNAALTSARSDAAPLHTQSALSMPAKSRTPVQANATPAANPAWSVATSNRISSSAPVAENAAETSSGSAGTSNRLRCTAHSAVEGAGLGTTMGDTGELLGTTDGAGVGRTVGCSVGTEVGEAVGCKVTRVRFDEGVKVGSLVVENVGPIEGFSVSRINVSKLSTVRGIRCSILPLYSHPTAGPPKSRLQWIGLQSSCLN